MGPVHHRSPVVDWLMVLVNPLVLAPCGVSICLTRSGGKPRSFLVLIRHGGGVGGGGGGRPSRDIATSSLVNDESLPLMGKFPCWPSHLLGYIAPVDQIHAHRMRTFFTFRVSRRADDVCLTRPPAEHGVVW